VRTRIRIRTRSSGSFAADRAFGLFETDARILDHGVGGEQPIPCRIESFDGTLTEARKIP